LNINIEQNPRQLFIIDGLGALTSALLLGIVLVRFEDFFGIPSSVLYTLAFIPILFAIYDLYCYRNKNRQIAFYLKGIAILNLSYCCLSLFLSFQHKESITVWGWLYIIGEVIVIAILSWVEYNTANRLRTGVRKS